MQPTSTVCAWRERPWCLILTPDYRECQRSLSKMLAEQDEPPSLWAWDCLQGHRCLSDTAQTSYLGSPDDTVQAPALLLKKALELPANSVLFFIVPKNDMVEDAAVIQGIANLRNEFKANKRTLVLLGRNISCRPSSPRTCRCWKTRCQATRRFRASSRAWSRASADGTASTPRPSGSTRATDLCRGLTRFATEEAVARNLTKQGIDLKGLADMQRRIIELATDRGLVYERGSETFDDIGGQASFKKFLQGLFSGPRRPRLVVRWDEIDKSVSSSAAGDQSPTTPASARTCSRCC